MIIDIPQSHLKVLVGVIHVIIICNSGGLCVTDFTVCCIQCAADVVAKAGNLRNNWPSNESITSIQILLGCVTACAASATGGFEVAGMGMAVSAVNLCNITIAARVGSTIMALLAGTIRAVIACISMTGLAESPS
jgi:hypothetical protein